MLITAIVRRRRRYDEGCKEYVQRITECTEAAATTVSEIGLYDAIVKGLQGPARQAAAKALESEKPLDIINKYMIPALDFVGHGFERKLSSCRSC